MDSFQDIIGSRPSNLAGCRSVLSMYLRTLSQIMDVKVRLEKATQAEQRNSLINGKKAT
jgi:hypothetical protein